MTVKRIVIATIGSLGDFVPYFALAKGFRDSGFDVTLATHLKYKERVVKENIKFSEIRLDPDKMIEDGMKKLMLEKDQNTLIFISALAQVIYPFVKELIEDLEKAVEGSDALLYSALVMGAPDVAQKFGVKTFSVLLQPLSPTNEIHSPFSKEAPFGKLFYNKLTYHGAWLSYWLIFKDIINNVRESRYKLKRIKTLTPFLWHKKMKIPYIYGFSRYLIPKPADWDENTFVTGYWFNEEKEHFEKKDDFDSFIGEDKNKPIYFGLGSMSGANEQRSVDLIDGLLKKTNERIVLLTHNISAKIKNDRVFSSDYMPHEYVFPKMKAVIHHGGAGTTSMAVKHGKYQILMPVFSDQFLWSEIVRKKGIGLYPFPFNRANPDLLASVVNSISANSCSDEKLKDISILVKREKGIENAISIIKHLI